MTSIYYILMHFYSLSKKDVQNLGGFRPIKAFIGEKEYQL